MNREDGKMGALSNTYEKASDDALRRLADTPSAYREAKEKYEAMLSETGSNPSFPDRFLRFLIILFVITVCISIPILR